MRGMMHLLGEKGMADACAYIQVKSQLILAAQDSCPDVVCGTNFRIAVRLECVGGLDGWLQLVQCCLDQKIDKLQVVTHHPSYYMLRLTDCHKGEVHASTLALLALSSYKCAFKNEFY